jgi:hypothetical protein
MFLLDNRRRRSTHDIALLRRVRALSNTHPIAQFRAWGIDDWNRYVCVNASQEQPVVNVRHVGDTHSWIAVNCSLPRANVFVTLVNITRSVRTDLESLRRMSRSSG